MEEDKIARFLPAVLGVHERYSKNLQIIIGQQVRKRTEQPTRRGREKQMARDFLQGTDNKIVNDAKK